jgi:predicted CoA-substrate-specific enzyme activase
MSCVIGIDIGSCRSKGVLFCESRIVASFECPSGGDFSITAENIREELISTANLEAENVDYVMATGYGSKVVSFADETKSDLTCHSAGIHSVFSAARTVIDVGDLYTKVFKVDAEGNLQNFLLSGKCAGGSGRVLPVIAKVLHINVKDIGKLSLKSKNRVDFNTGCLVFAESEAISRIAEGVSKEDLLAGIHRALASQISGLAERLGVEEPIALVGGGARDLGLVKTLEKVMGFELYVPDAPHFTAALGAAILGAEKVGARNG